MNHYQFFQQLWQDYVGITPQAEAIQRLFIERGETIVNDHVAFRTLAQSPISLERLQPLLEQLGYRAFGQYHFATKKLRARAFAHEVDATAPKIFLSELEFEQLSDKVQAIIHTLLAQVPEDAASDVSVFWSGRHWAIPTWEAYEALLKESEYAAWLSVLGLRANHFTVSVNHLETLPDLKAVNQLLKDHGYALNVQGGEIKGSPGLLLEQSSTLADHIAVEFGEGETHRVPSCYYEFALRYEESPGKLFAGFIEGNADKIFESTHSRDE
ncbi:MAG: succinyldiaminopimelate aminotransferase [Oceanospirillaceae bacterium]|nr:succinyldiaminopimelate aminotransferase [Oceanospirillaceae bacterium]